MKIIIAGSRYFDDYEKMERLVLSVIGDIDNIEIVSGCCRVNPGECQVGAILHL